MTKEKERKKSLEAPPPASPGADPDRGGIKYRV
jgi:hypothetical protein